MLETSTRLLQLLELLQSRPYWSGPELSDRLEVGPRTVRRDIDRLRRLGYPVDASPGVAGGYRLRAGAQLPPLLLDDEEAVAIAVGLRTAVHDGIAGIEETSVRALSKLEQLLPSRVRRRVQAIGAATVPYRSSGPVVDAEVLLTIATACRDHERLRFGYRAHDDARSERQIEPQSLVHTGRRWYLVAWDLDRSDWRTFRVDRVEKPRPTGHRFAARTPPAPDLAEFVARGVSAVRDHDVRIVLYAPLDDLLPRSKYRFGTLEARDERSSMLLARTDWLDGVALYVAGLGVDFEIEEPPELIGRIERLAARFAAAALGRSTSA